MPTETQKNFKKQMAEIQKDLGNKNQQSYFSYIENDHIESYYKPRNTRKIATISIGSIISFLLIAYSIYSWIRPVMRYSPNQKTESNIMSSALTPGLRSHSEIVNYLQVIESFDNEVNKYISSIVQDLNNTNNKQDSKLAQNLANYISRMDTIMTGISSIPVPKELQQHHAVIQAKYKNINDLMFFSMDATKNRSKYNMDSIRDLLQSINEKQNQQKQLMLTVFDSVGIRYEKTDNQIRYWYNK